MKTRTSIPARCLAIALAFILAVSNAVPGLIIQAYAAEGHVRAGEVVAESYVLTDAEKAILKSGYLAGDNEVSIPAVDAGWVTVDTDAKKVVASDDGEWAAVSAEIIAGGATVENLTFTDGEAAYTYDGNAFSVKVVYVLDKVVGGQQTMLDAIVSLKNGVANTEAVSAQSGNLYILEQAMPELVKFANEGYKVTIGGSTSTANFTDEVKEAIYSLNNEMTANDGKVDLSAMISTYESGSETEYLIANGLALKEEAVSVVERLTKINEALNTILNFMGSAGWITEELKSQFTTLVGVCENLENGLASVIAEGADWSAATETVVGAGVDYAALDTLVKALGELSEVTVSDTLRIADEAVTVNMNMKDVTVKVVLNVVEDAADSAVLVEAGSKQAVVTVTAGASREDVLAEITAEGVEAAALAEWVGIYEEAHFVRTATELPETVDEDTEYVITYAPKSYNVTGLTGVGAVPYGYQLTLPKHADSTKAYDYTVNGVKYAQGTVYKVIGDTVVERTSGKSYVSGQLYALIADCFGNDVTKNILKSGAVYGDLALNYRKIDPTDVEAILSLTDDVLYAKDYASDYNGLVWEPYKYGENGTYNAFPADYDAEAGIAWTEKGVKVQYELAFTGIVEEDSTVTDGLVKAQEVLALAKALKEEAEKQKGAMDSLAAMEETLSQLDRTKLGALNGVIDVTDFTEGDGTDKDQENLDIRVELKSVINKIINGNLSGDYLKVYNIVLDYKADGLAYYYRNYSTIYSEIDGIADYLTDLMDQEEALVIMCTKAGYPEYADKISDVETKLNSYLGAMSEPNAMINVESENLGKLVAALTAEGTATDPKAAGVPYIHSEFFTVTDDSQAYIQVIIETPEGDATATTTPVDSGTEVTEEMIKDLSDKIDAEIERILGSNKKYYEVAIEGGDIEALVKTKLDDNVNITYTYSYKEYTFKIEGADDQVVTINDLEVNLPKHGTPGYVYRYTVDGVEGIVSSTYTFNLKQIDRLFIDGSYTASRIEVNEAAEKFKAAFGSWVVEDAHGNVIGLNASIDGNSAGISDFAMTMVYSSYSYIALNGEPLLYLNAENSLEVCLQTLINAILSDNDFGSDTLIDLGENLGGKVVSAKMDLGNSAEEITQSNIDFTLVLNSVPSQMTTVSNGLTKIEPYMTFDSNNGVLDINIDLPEKVYEVYLTAMLATGNVDKYDITALNSEIAFQFLWDYVDLIINTEADAQTYTNTLAKLGFDYDLTGYDKYYQYVKKALTHEGLEVNPDEDGIFDMVINAPSQASINALLGFLGLDTSDLGEYETYLAMVKEYKSDAEVLSVSINANLVDAGTEYEALVLDVRHSVDSKLDYLKKFDYTNNLAARAASIAGEAAIILLDDVTGNLVFNDATIIDLNGHTITGDITANGTTLIFDSCMDTFDCGGVDGNIYGNATIVGGRYTCDVTGFIPSGFEVEDSTVRNILYTISDNGGSAYYALANDTVNVMFKVDADIIDKDIASYTEAAAMIAADMAVDLLLNYYTTASLTADGYSIYNVSVADIIGIYDSTNRKEQLINTVLGWVDLNDINGFINDVIDQLLDFANIENAIDTDDAIMKFNVTTAPWNVTVDHVTSGDYLTFGIGANEDKAKTVIMGLMMDGSDGKKDYAADFFGGLSDMVELADAQIEIDRPGYSNKKFSFSGSGEATLIIDVTTDHNTENDTDYSAEEYVNVLAVVMANGIKGTAKADKLVAAIESGDKAAMKAAIDALTVNDVFTALKNMSVANTFDKMVEDLGITADLGDAAALEEIYHLIANAAGEGLEALDISGGSRTLGSLYNDATDYYEWTGKREFNKAVSESGYTVDVTVDITEVTLKVKLFETHVHDYEAVVTPPTCTEQGYTTYTCECGDSYVADYVDALGHSYDAVVTPPTCTEGGYTTYTCSRCGDSYVDNYVDATGHAWGETEHIWDETADGMICIAKRVCANDPTHVETEAGTVTSEVTKEATCCEEGVITYTATFVNKWAGTSEYTVAIAIDPDAHNYTSVVTDPTCTEDGYTTHTCSICGNSYKDSIVPALGHSYDAVVTDPTCTEPGYTTYTCSRCGDSYVSNEVPALGHDWGDWEIHVAARPGERGIKKRVCANCGEVQYKYYYVGGVPDDDEEGNPETGASIAAISAICAIAVIGGSAIVSKKSRKH